VASDVVILAKENGPLVVMKEGKVVTALCRCGGSGNKPYCDGSHKKIGFTAPQAEVKV